MSLFENLTNDQFEEQKDTLGGFSTLDSNVYDALIKLVYVTKSQSGAMGVTLIADIDDREYKETVYITNKNGENYYNTKSNPPKKMPLPGFTILNDLCLICCGKPLNQMGTEDKIVQLYNPTVGKEVPTQTPVIMDLLNKRVKLGILKEVKNKVQSTDSGYVETDETREGNVINKVFDYENGRTVYEINHDLTESPLFVHKWLEKNKDIVIDHTKKKGNINSSKPVPPKPTEHKSLFTSD